MSSEQIKAIAQTFIDAVNRQDTTAMAEVMTSKWAAEVTSWFPGVNARWPGHHIEVTDMVAEGDQVWCRLRTNALGRGEWMGLPATGKPWTNSGIWFLRITDGRVSELEGLFDELNLIRQYGGKVVPANQSASRVDQQHHHRGRLSMSSNGTSKLHFGLFYDFRNPPQWHRPYTDLYSEIFEQIVWADTHGFDNVWISEHHLNEDGYAPSVLPIAAAIAPRRATSASAQR